MIGHPPKLIDENIIENGLSINSGFLGISGQNMMHWAI